MIGTCDYCLKTEVEIVKSFSSETCNAICGECNSQVQMIAPLRLLEPAGSVDMDYVRWVARLAYEWFAEPANISKEEVLPDSNSTSRRKNLRDHAASRNRFRSIVKAKPCDWMPLKVFPSAVIQWGAKPLLDLSYFDGTHRLAVALALGIPEIPVWIRPTRHTFSQSRIYQTMILPDGIVKGDRPPDRWPMMPRYALEGKRIIDLAGNAGSHGILSCLLSPTSTYDCYDIDEAAIETGQKVASAWGISQRVRYHVSDVNKMVEFPECDTLLYLSCCKVVSVDAFKRAVNASHAKTILFESHNIHDDPDAERVLSIPLDWRYLGATATVEGGPYVRRLFVAKVDRML